jgi:hypothetical protein
MAGNFRGVLIFVIFVVDLQSRKFPLPKINNYRYVSIDEGRGQKYRGSAATRSLCSISNNIAAVIQLVASCGICLSLFAEVGQ